MILSATIFDFPTFRRVLGMPDDALTFSAPSDFPLRNRPIFYRPAGDMAAKAINHTIPHLCTEIERILSEFSRSKGVIHTHSYVVNQCVFKHLTAKFGYRVITHGQNPKDREQAIRRHCASHEPSVLVSPSLAEGVDLKGDLARFQVICKVPYPRLDAYTRARCVRDRAWYELQTAWGLVQMIGRAVRSETDSATTFVLDSQFEKFVVRNEAILPLWWRAASQKGWSDTLAFGDEATRFFFFIRPAQRLRFLGSRFPGVKVHSRESGLLQIPPSWFVSGAPLKWIDPDTAILAHRNGCWKGMMKNRKIAPRICHRGFRLTIRLRER